MALSSTFLATHRPRAKPRLLTVIPNLRYGGAERVVANLLHAMRPELFDYHLVTMAPSINAVCEFPIPDHVSRSLIEASRVEASSFGLARLLRRLKPDLVCSHIAAMNVVTGMAYAVTRSRARLVFVDHHVASRTLVSSGPFHALLSPSMRLTYRLCDCIVGVSRAVLEDSLRIVGDRAKKGIVIPNAVVTPNIQAMSEHASDHPWLDDPGFDVVLGIGRLVAFKNFELLIDAFALVAQRRLRARLVIMGEGPLLERHQAHIDRLGLTQRAELVGHCKNPFPGMRRARTVAVTSHSEGLSTVMIEAAALGTPVVATNFVSARDALPGWAVPVPFHPAAVAEALERQLDQTPDRHRLQAWASQFEVASIARRYEQLFLDLSSQERANRFQRAAGRRGAFE
jgi:glycosyltransferase involved in cell wall biosynthesis